MNASNTQRLTQLIALVDREDILLAGVRHRLLGTDCNVNAARVQEILADDAGMDRLESFGAKFGRMQDTVVDKLIPAVLREAGEPVAAAIDNLSRMERLQLVTEADDWLQMRSLRNRLVHEYIDQAEELAQTLERACQFSQRMHTDYLAIREYATTRLAIEASAHRHE